MYRVSIRVLYIIFVDSKNSSFPFRIHDGRKEWLNLIRQNQSIDENGRLLYICDLHFNPSDIRKYTTKTVLQKNAAPNIGYELIFYRIIKAIDSFSFLFFFNSISFMDISVYKSQMKTVVQVLQVRPMETIHQC